VGAPKVGSRTKDAKSELGRVGTNKNLEKLGHSFPKIRISLPTTFSVNITQRNVIKSPPSKFFFSSLPDPEVYSSEQNDILRMSAELTF